MDGGEKVKRNVCPKEDANIFSIVTFYYTYKIILQGFRKNLEEEDLCDVYEKLQSAKLGAQIEKKWLSIKNQKLKISLAAALWKCYGVRFIIFGIIRLIATTCNSALTPAVIGRLVEYFSPETEITRREAYTHAALLMLFKLLDVFIFHNFFLLITEFGILVRAAVNSLMFRKCLRLSPGAQAEYAAGKIITLVTKDIQSVDGFVVYGNDIWIAFCEAIFISYNLYSRIGVITFVGLGALLFMMPLQFYISRKFAHLRTAYCRESDFRLQKTQEALSAIKIIKMYTWETIFANRISHARKLEISKLRTANILSTIVYVSGVLITQLALYALLNAYTNQAGFSAENIFYIAYCFEALRSSVATTIPDGCQYVAEFAAAYLRIFKLLSAEERLVTDAPGQAIVENPKVQFENASTKINDTPILSNVTCEFVKGLNLVTGPVGSGKSMLLKLILKEYPLTGGNMNVTGKISYSSQEPWLFPGTIRNNILFGEKYDEERYRKVLSVCALELDLDILVKGDETIVEDNGMNLSKGQQTRINLARAIYRKSNIYLLDDSLAALDVTVQDHVFNKCFREFLSGKICIFVSHNVKFVTRADQVVVLNEGHLENIAASNVHETIAKIQDVMDNSNLQPKEKLADNLKDEEIKENGLNNTKLMTLEDMETNLYKEVNKIGAVDFSVYRRYINYGGGTMVALFIFVLFIVSKFLEGYWDRLLSDWVNLDANKTQLLHENKSDTEEYMEIDKKERRTFITYTVVLGFSIVATLVKHVCFFIYVSRISIKLHRRMIESVLQATMSFFDHTFIGNILNRFSRDLCLIDERMTFVLVDCIGYLLESFAAFGLMATVNISYWIPAILLCMCLVAWRRIYMPSGRSLKRLDCATRSPLVGHINTSLEGLTTIRACNKKKELLNQENVGLALTKAFSLSYYFQWGIRGWAEFENLLTSVERVLEYTDIESERKCGRAIENWPNKGSLKYENVSLVYHKTNEVVLKDIDFTIYPKEKIGIVGRTGAGKTSLISSLFRLYEVDGEILLDDVDLKTVSLKYLRSRISIIPPFPVLFQGTIRSNMDPLREYTDADIWRALDKVGLKSDVGDLEEPVEDHSNQFSTGQRQLFCLARALVRRNKLIVLDEATANMDPETEALVTALIAKEFADCTVLIVAHKLATVLRTDRVMVLDRGSLLEFDSPQNLLKDSSSRFYEMVQNDR